MTPCARRRDTDSVGTGERRGAEERLRESEERFRLLVESTSDYAIFMLDPAGRVVSWNAGAERIKGYAAEEIIGRHFSTFYPPEAMARHWPEHELREAARVGRFEDEGWRVRKDGSRFWANVVITALRGADGALCGFSKVTRDITDRKRYEAELDAANRELEQRNAENESFVYSVSHDLRSPLVNLKGFSQELAVTGQQLRQLLESPSVPSDISRRAVRLLDSKFQESLTFIGKAVSHLDNIVDGLLRLSRAGRIEYEFRSVDVTEIVQELLRAMHSSVKASGARIDVRALPAVRADRNALGQVFANLLGNALKSFHPGRPGEIEISASADDPPVFAIRDNGVGIPEEYRPKIFRLLEPVEPTRAQGEGMGLAIVHRIIQRHGGRIWFESNDGNGTTFYFTVGRRAPDVPGATEVTRIETD